MAAFSNCAVCLRISSASVAASRLLLLVMNLAGVFWRRRGSAGGDFLVTARLVGLSSVGASSAGLLFVVVKFSFNHRCICAVVAVDGVAWVGQAVRPVL